MVGRYVNTTLEERFSQEYFRCTERTHVTFYDMILRLVKLGSIYPKNQGRDSWLLCVLIHAGVRSLLVPMAVA